jgi:hypothetical protein
MIPHRLFDRLFGAREEGWVNRKRSILDAVRADASMLTELMESRRRMVVIWQSCAGQSAAARGYWKISEWLPVRVSDPQDLPSTFKCYRRTGALPRTAGSPRGKAFVTMTRRCRNIYLQGGGRVVGRSEGSSFPVALMRLFLVDMCR